MLAAQFSADSTPHSHLVQAHFRFDSRRAQCIRMLHTMPQTMNDANQNSAATSFNAARYLPLLLLLFAGSGCSALIYEIVWYQLLQLTIGSTTVSLAFLLATFMGGLCIGSIWLPRLKSRKHPLRIYAYLELGIAAFGILVQLCIPLIERIYFAGAGSGLTNMIMRALVSALILLPPTILMGASLPAIVGWIESTPARRFLVGPALPEATPSAPFSVASARWILFAARFQHGDGNILWPPGINVVVALLSLMLAGLTPDRAVVGDSPDAPIQSAPEIKMADSTDADTLSRWPHLCNHRAFRRLRPWRGSCLDATARHVARRNRLRFLHHPRRFSNRPRHRQRRRSMARSRGSSACQRSAGARIFAHLRNCVDGLHMIADSLPVLARQSDAHHKSLVHLPTRYGPLPLGYPSSNNFVGRKFPARSRRCGLIRRRFHARSRQRLRGKYFRRNHRRAGGQPDPDSANRHAGYAARFALALAAVSSLFVLVPHFILKYKSLTAITLLTASIIFSGFLIRDLDPIPGELIAYGRRMAIDSGRSTVLYTREGMNSSVAITQWNDRPQSEVDVNGHVEATTEPYDMKLQRMVGHLAALLHPTIRNPFSVSGFGAGVSAGTFTTYPGIQKITVDEIEPVIPPTSTKYFYKQDYDVLHNPRTTIHFDDARHYMLTTKDK